MRRSGICVQLVMRLEVVRKQNFNASANCGIICAANSDVRKPLLLLLFIIINNNYCLLLFINNLLYFIKKT